MLPENYYVELIETSEAGKYIKVLKKVKNSIEKKKLQHEIKIIRN